MDEIEKMNHYQLVLANVVTRLNEGFRPKYEDEGDSLYKFRKESWETGLKGMVRMCNHQLGQDKVRVVKRFFG